MSIAPITPTITAADLLENPRSGRCELIQGELTVMSPSGIRHAWVAGAIGAILYDFVKKHRLGYVLASEGGFLIETDPDTVRAPDIAFLALHRAPKGLPESYFPGAPDLAVEVLSPGDRSTEVNAKAEQWLRCGSRAVWLIDPIRETAARCELLNGEFHLYAVKELAEPDILPEFSVTVASLFE